MLDTQLAHLWSVQPDFPAQLRRWHWCRDAHAALLLGRARALGSDGVDATVDRPALAQAFWTWAALLEQAQPLEARDAVDVAHFASGALLWQWLRHPPLVLPRATHEAPQVRVLTDAALTLLQGWRVARGAPPLDAELEARVAQHWTSYLENVREDAGQAIAFLDLFSGARPVWRYPTHPQLRPAFVAVPA